MRLSNTYKLFGRYQSVFVRCSYQYHARCGLQNDWREAGETEVTPILPCEKGYLFNCCIVIPLPLGVSDGGSLSPTGRLQRFLTERSAGRGERGALRDITLQFECIGTNESNSRVYMKNKVPSMAGGRSIAVQQGALRRVAVAELAPAAPLDALLHPAQRAALRHALPQHGQLARARQRAQPLVPPQAGEPARLRRAVRRRLPRGGGAARAVGLAGAVDELRSVQVGGWVA